MLLEIEEEFGLMPCGLAARDALRTGTVLLLAHQAIGAWPFINHPWHFALGFKPAKTISPGNLSAMCRITGYHLPF